MRLSQLHTSVIREGLLDFFRHPLYALDREVGQWSQKGKQAWQQLNATDNDAKKQLLAKAVLLRKKGLNWEQSIVQVVTDYLNPMAQKYAKYGFNPAS